MGKKRTIPFGCTMQNVVIETEPTGGTCGLNNFQRVHGWTQSERNSKGNDCTV